MLQFSTPVTLDEQRHNELVQIAKRAADAAAIVTRRYFREPMQVENKASKQFDPVTQADREAEQAIRTILNEHTPEIGFYGEEYGRHDGKNALLWVVDPIDGTRAFMSGMPLWGTLLGLYNGQEAILGIIDQPFIGERYCAANGQAWFEVSDSRQALVTRKQRRLSEATAYCTTPDMFFDPVAKQCFDRLKESVQLMRYGGDCYAYALLAAGYIDLVIDADLKPYDIVAPIAVVESAGGIVTNWDGQSAVNGGYVIASGSEDLHAEALALLQNTGRPHTHC